ncbi:hypothetical protein OS493_013539 [Desmophyllum pertusum]|uniref:Phosphorylated adapter RNA export protein n=1 Tax=Desmophyllum pertusum TaxID=174260 RepID=A0A9X0A2B7_9CNID|nr:hypothetical protein OS493_013539 [Desmophyllum pertusum]
MADCVQERFEAEIDLDVAFNEFDEELSDFRARNCDANKKTTSTNDKRKDIRQHDRASIANVSISCKEQLEPSITNGSYTDNVPKLAKIEDGEISSASDGEDNEKMDCDEEIGVNLNPVSLKTAKISVEDGKETNSFTFLPPSSVAEESSKKEKELLDEEFMSDTAKFVGETESAILSMESDNSMDDQSWKRHKRARLEKSSHEPVEEKKKHEKDGDRVNRRGGKKKRKRPLHDRHDEGQRHRSNNQRESEIVKLFEPLKVTLDDPEEAVAKEIAEKLNEAKTMLIERVVTCIGCEKALKLFKDTKEVQKHGGMWTQDRQRRRTSGGIFWRF